MAGRLAPPSSALALGIALAALALGPAACSGEDASTGDGAALAHAKPYLWVVEGPTPVFLFGTIHVNDPRVRDLPEIVTGAFDASDTLATELALDEDSQTKASLLSIRLSLLEEGQDLLSVLGPDLFRRMSALLPSNVPLANLHDRQPWFVWLLLTQAEALPHLSGGQPLDVVLHERALAAGKEVSALETASAQLMLFSTFPLADQKRMLELAVTDWEAARKANRDPMEALIDVYLGGDEAALLEAVNRAWNPDDPVGRALRARLVDGRNVRMAEAIVEKMAARPDATHFVAVGAAHLAGERGVPALLREKGYVVRRLKVGDALPAPPAAGSRGE